jgi:hypothetical protein
MWINEIGDQIPNLLNSVVFFFKTGSSHFFSQENPTVW